MVFNLRDMVIGISAFSARFGGAHLLFTSSIIRLNLVSLGLLSCLFCVGASGADSRLASLDEIQALFDLATVGPQRMRVVADIFSNETKWSDEQIAAEIKNQNELFKDLARLPEARQQDRTNAVARSHSGRRILHVQEWYSGGHYRLDQTDEGMVSAQYLKNHPGTYRESYVNIDDPALSPHRSFYENHELHDVQLSETTLYSKNDLWRVLGLEGELALPLMIALLDPKSGPHGTPARDADSRMFKMKPAKEERIHNGSDPNWHSEAIPENGQENRTRFILRGRCVLPDKPDGLSDVEVVCEVGRVGQRTVCMEASVTNHTAHNSFISKREGFDAQGFPRVWKRTTIRPGSPAQQLDVVFKEVELNPTFSDEQVFLPVFATNYIVADLTSGRAVVLQNPLRSIMATQPLAHVTSVKRVIVLCVFGLATLGMGIALLRMKGDKA
jgi:hypothetical protein